MKKIGFRFECKVLNSADYGAPTKRVRWYAEFRSDERAIEWPVPTNNKFGNDGLKPWEPISDYLDFTDLGNSIFTRKTPLKEATLNRIARGVKKFVVEDENRFILPDTYSYPFLIQYHGETKNGGVRGQKLTEPLMTIDTSNRYALITAFLTKFYKTGIGQSINEPVHTLTTSGAHFGLISCFLTKYYGCGTGQSCNMPIDTITTKDRFALTTVIIDGETYQLVDIYYRMLKTEECKLGQGFPMDYIIDHDYKGKPYPKKEQMERIGNSVVPLMAQKLVEANCPYLKVGERMPNMSIDDSQEQLKFA
jgi:DNA (cytosine-5)-methyltransferase 1